MSPKTTPRAASEVAASAGRAAGAVWLVIATKDNNRADGRRSAWIVTATGALRSPCRARTQRMTRFRHPVAARWNSRTQFLQSSSGSTGSIRHEEVALLSARAIDRLTLDGAGHIHAGPWTSESLEVRVSGAGDVKLDRLKAARFSCEVDGSGDVLLAGAVYNQRIVLSGSGRYRASDLKSQTATVTINGSAEVELWAEHKLDARISGSGDVRYYGAPAVTQSVSGSGRLTSLGAKNAP